MPIRTRGQDKVRKRPKILVHLTIECLVVDFEDTGGFRLISIGRLKNLYDEITF